jgi:hypothetical protein
MAAIENGVNNECGAGTQDGRHRPALDSTFTILYWPFTSTDARFCTLLHSFFSFSMHHSAYFHGAHYLRRIKTSKPNLYQTTTAKVKNYFPPLQVIWMVAKTARRAVFQWSISAHQTAAGAGNFLFSILLLKQPEVVV